MTVSMEMVRMAKSGPRKEPIRTLGFTSRLSCHKINRGYYTVARRYEFYFRVAKQYFTNERSEWVKYCFCHEKIKFISSSRRVMFPFYYIDMLMTGVLMIFRRFPTTFRRFQKIFQNLFRRPDERSRTFSENSEDVRRFPKIFEDCRRLSRKTRRCFDYITTNLSTI